MLEMARRQRENANKQVKKKTENYFKRLSSPAIDSSSSDASET
jgi:hypothetical protein